MSSLSGVTFVFFCFVFVVMSSLKPPPFFQAFFVLLFDMHASRKPHGFLPFFLFFLDVAFSEYFCTIITVFSLNGEYVARFPLPNAVFPTALWTRTRLLTSAYLCENSINQAISTGINTHHNKYIFVDAKESMYMMRGISNCLLEGAK